LSKVNLNAYNTLKLVTTSGGRAANAVIKFKQSVIGA
jgi:hypothetical protein